MRIQNLNSQLFLLQPSGSILNFHSNIKVRIPISGHFYCWHSTAVRYHCTCELMARVWSEGSMEQILIFKNPEAILIPINLKLNSQLSFQQNPILTELELSQNFPITVYANFLFCPPSRESIKMAPPPGPSLSSCACLHPSF